MTAVQKSPAPDPTRSTDTTPTAVMYGIGAMGSLMTRMLVDKGVSIVGAIARSPNKVGRDVGELAELGRELGVRVSDDADAVLDATRPDIVVMSIASYMDEMYPHVLRCVEAGANVISLAEELLYPWQTAPTKTAHLDAAAREHEVTIACTGHQDGYWVNLISVLMGTAHRIDTVHGYTSWNIDDFGAELARDQQVGASPAEFDAWVTQTQRPPTFGRTALQSLAAVTGLHPVDARTRTRPNFAQADLHCTALDRTVPAGNVIGFTDIDTITTDEGVTLSMEMTGKVYTPEESDSNEWRITGEPNLTLTNDALQTHLTTCATLVNRIPDVIAATPGYATLDQLPQLTYRHTLTA